MKSKYIANPPEFFYDKLNTIRTYIIKHKNIRFTSPDTFRHHLKTHYFQQAFQPT